MNYRKLILDYLERKGEVSLDQIMNDAGDLFYYNNPKKYVGLIISRLIKRGLVIRVKKGVYRLADAKPVKTQYYKFPNELKGNLPF